MRNKVITIQPDHQSTRRPPLWLSSLPPQQGLVICGLLILFCLIGTLWLLLSQPSLGIVWAPSPDNHGLIIQEILHYQQNPVVSTGDRILFLAKVNGEPAPLDNELIIQDPDLLATYGDYNRFFERQGIIMDILRQPRVTLITASGAQLIVTPVHYRAMDRIPLAFWINNLSAAICLLIGAGVWCYRRGQAEARLLALTGLGFFGGILCLSIYSSRELALEPDLFLALSIGNHFFMCLYVYSFYCLLWYYPQPLGRRWLVMAVYLAMGFTWLNQTFQWFEPPWHPYYVTTFLIPYLSAIPVLILQWRKSYLHPIEHTAFKWFLLSIFISLGLCTAALLLPPVFQRYNVVPFWMVTLIVLFMYLCLALGILRYGLFHLERWWFSIWIWFISGIVLIINDFLLIQLFHLAPANALIMAVLITGWIYFPFRQWLWARLIRPTEDRLESHLPKLMESLVSSPTVTSFLDQWAELLRQVYQPVSISTLPATVVASVAVSQNGLLLQIPRPDGQQVYELVGNKRGTRLFGPADIALANLFLLIARRSILVKQAREEAAAEERDRIMRDLHDDVGAKLLNLMQRAASERESELARSALISLKDTIYALNHQAAMPLEDALGDWRAEIHERLESMPIRLLWIQPEKLPQLSLSPRQYVNCSQILREAVSNTIKHADASEIQISFNVAGRHFHVTISDNGKGLDIAQWVLGNGLINMRRRAGELNGALQWSQNANRPNGYATGITITLNFRIQETPLASPLPVELESERPASAH